MPLTVDTLQPGWPHSSAIICVAHCRQCTPSLVLQKFASIHAGIPWSGNNQTAQPLLVLGLNDPHLPAKERLHITWTNNPWKQQMVWWTPSMSIIRWRPRKVQGRNRNNSSGIAVDFWFMYLFIFNWLCLDKRWSHRTSLRFQLSLETLQHAYMGESELVFSSYWVSWLFSLTTLSQTFGAISTTLLHHSQYQNRRSPGSLLCKPSLEFLNPNVSWLFQSDNETTHFLRYLWI